MICKIIFATILILSGTQTFSQDSIKGRITGYEGNYIRPVFPGATIIIEPMPGVTIIDGNNRQNGTISDRYGNFKIEVKGDKRELEIQFVGFYGIRFINIPKVDKTIDLKEIKLVTNHLMDNQGVGGPSEPISQEQYEQDKKLRNDVREKYRINILGKNVKPYFERQFLVFDFDKQGDQ